MTTLALPTTEEEIWRYSRIDDLDLGAYSPQRCSTQVVGDPAILVQSSEASVLKHEDVFTQTNLENSEAIVIQVPKSHAGGVVEIIHRFDASGALYCPRVVIEAGENSEVSVVERFVSADGVKALVIPVLDVRAAQAARVSYLAVNELSATTWMIAHQEAEGERDSNLSLSVVALGGDYARVRTE